MQEPLVKCAVNNNLLIILNFDSHFKINIDDSMTKRIQSAM